MDPIQSQGPLALVASAVTPVVMVSATAILISGVNAKHISLADRLRSLAVEYRALATTDRRRQNILAQTLIFQRRLRLATVAHMALYSATACFIAMVLVISLTPIRQAFVAVTLPFFLAGVILLFTAVVGEIMELRWAAKTMALELSSLHDSSHL